MDEKNRNIASTFLGSVAKAYSDNFGDLSQFCFVLPNKRAGTFFLRRLRETLGDKPVLAPRVMAIADFVECLSGKCIDSRIDMLFRLYNVYCRLRGREEGVGSLHKLLDFDSFRSWGETIISDFNEVDQYCVDPEAIFKNVKDYREIASNFLTQTQKELLERYFGYHVSMAEVESFWKKLVPREEHEPLEKNETKARFMHLWQQLLPLYHGLTEELDAEGLCMPGGAYRLALDNLETHGKDILPWKKIVMVGFNALSTAEARIFDTLLSLDSEPGIKGDFAEFFWDATGPVLGQDRNDATSFLKYNKKNFPSPDWAQPYIELNRRSKMPEIMRAIASPSNSGQAKIAGDILRKFIEKEGDAPLLDARVAVVLPDESMLMPLIYGLPEIEKVNITMGYPLRLTSVASFIAHLRKLRAGMRFQKDNPGKGSDEAAYYFDDLKMFLAHPFCHTMLGTSTVSRLTEMITGRHTLLIPLSEISKVSEKAAWLLRKLPKNAGLADTAAYIDDILLNVSAELVNADGTIVKRNIDREHIEAYRDALRRLVTAASRHNIEMHTDGVFTMIDKLLAGETVSFEGMPLEGLQVMGLLETRALDFDYVIILSMNDRVMPMRSRKRTFIPDALRHGYGLPYSSYQEDLFSYYFYRMISRADGVAMVYDARSGEGMRSGTVSRYIQQLRHLYAKGVLKEESYRFRLSERVSPTGAIPKTDAVMEKLNAFLRPDSKRHLSASVLKKYASCPVRFYYEAIVGIKADSPQESVYIDPATMGNIIHRVMLEAYFPEDKRNRYLDKPIVLDTATIDSISRNDELLSVLIRRAINIEHFHIPAESPEASARPLTGAALLQEEHIKGRVREIMAYDRTLAPIGLVGGEIKGRIPWNFKINETEDASVFMKYAIDRLDIINFGKASEQYRIVDYKTGLGKVKAVDMSRVFDGSVDAENLLQLMLYANVMERDPKSPRCRGDVRLSIYETERIERQGETIPVIEREPVAGYKQHQEEFTQNLDAMLSSIFDKETPFMPAQKSDACTYCNLAVLCGKGC